MTNREVFARAGCEAMSGAQTRKRKLRYYGHVVRHPSLEHTIMFGMMAGMKRQGGQKRQWVDDICTWASTAAAPVPVAPNGRLPEACIKSVLEMMSLARDCEILEACCS